MSRVEGRQRMVAKKRSVVEEVEREIKRQGLVVVRIWEGYVGRMLRAREVTYEGSAFELLSDAKAAGAKVVFLTTRLLEGSDLKFTLLARGEDGVRVETEMSAGDYEPSLLKANFTGEDSYRLGVVLGGVSVTAMESTDGYDQFFRLKERAIETAREQEAAREAERTTKTLSEGMDRADQQRRKRDARDAELHAAVMEFALLPEVYRLPTQGAMTAAFEKKYPDARSVVASGEFRVMMQRLQQNALLARATAAEENGWGRPALAKKPSE